MERYGENWKQFTKDKYFYTYDFAYRYIQEEIKRCETSCVGGTLGDTSNHLFYLINQTCTKKSEIIDNFINSVKIRERDLEESI